MYTQTSMAIHCTTQFTNKNTIDKYPQDAIYHTFELYDLYSKIAVIIARYYMKENKDIIQVDKSIRRKQLIKSVLQQAQCSKYYGIILWK